ncbi:MAG: hypothetical protein KKF85_11890 [Gammaproteobacteria bacterium]|nr:hypothetical protein [Rhodocyclaceae bacterium]MBU3908067.1 hypothetical protein [Gammaproteobacteria bacterium]MBU3990322.1 hypothetical protein [Gammaproteobacteria bacterium]MBU4006024.1 hypothetical protein [Gammaproteobacteria bacterium]MBU4022003.1 hypothetical protein [Gammaproteobacteria bacterium]
MKLDLPPTSTEKPPLFTSLEACNVWQKALPLSNPIQAQAQLLRQLHLLNRYSLSGDVRLAMLETLREAIHFVQEEGEKKFSGKPLPLAPPDQAALDAAHGLWQALAGGYARCLEAGLAEDEYLKPRIALVCQRALAALAEDQTDLVHAGHQPSEAHWRLAYALYASAESAGVATTAVAEVLHGDQPMTPAAALAELLLLAAASLHEMLPRQQLWVMRWARRWAGKIRIQTTQPELKTAALPLCVDIEGATPAGFKPLLGTGARWLDTTELRKSLKKRLTLLAKGDPADTPARLGLGEDCQQPMCGEVLRRIYPRWVKGGILRRYERHPMKGICRFVAGIDVIHYYLSGHRPFKPPGSISSDDLRRQREELATFGRIATRFEEEYSRNHGYQLESWEVVEDWGLLDQSSGGLRLVRPLAQAGGRLGIGQMVAVQPAGTSGLLLGMVRWVQVAGDSLAAGIQLIPGEPVPAAVRATGVMATQDKHKPAFILPPLEALKLPASIILLSGSFKPDRIVEVWTENGSWEIKLKTILDRGAGFERATYDEMPDR